MKIFKFFKDKKMEYRLSIEYHVRLMSSDMLWNLGVDVREVGKRKWNSLQMPEPSQAKVHNGREDYLNRNAWIYRQCPEQWWDETFQEVEIKLQELWTAFQYRMNNIKRK